MPHSINDTNIAFERLFNYYKVSTIRDLAEKLNMSESTVSKWRQRDSLNAIKKNVENLEFIQKFLAIALIHFHKLERTLLK